MRKVELTFKTSYNNHTHSFRNESKKSSTTLSTYIMGKQFAVDPQHQAYYSEKVP